MIDSYKAIKIITSYSQYGVILFACKTISKNLLFRLSRLIHLKPVYPRKIYSAIQQMCTLTQIPIVSKCHGK